MRGYCRVCRRSCALTRRGRVWWHKPHVHAPTPGQGHRCPGAGEPPLGQSGPDLPPLDGQFLAPSPLAREHGWPGTVYLVHFDEPFAHARHYLGWASPGNLNLRLGHHAAGTGANLLRHVAKAGIGWTLARTWPGDRTRERSMKAHGKTRICPVCRPEVEARLLAGVSLLDR